MSKKLFGTTWLALLVALLIGAWYIGSDTASGFKPGRGFEKIGDQLTGGWVLVAIFASLVVIAGLVYWMTKDGLSTKELVLSIALVVSWLIIISLLKLWPVIGHGIWSQAFLSLIIVMVLTLGGAWIVTYTNRR